MDASYAEAGTEVVICFHRPSVTRQDYCSRRTTIIQVADDGDACRVAADTGYYWWAVSNMILASDIDLLTPEQRVKIR